jgi:hypothetical protein
MVWTGADADTLENLELGVEIKVGALTVSLI